MLMQSIFCKSALSSEQNEVEAHYHVKLLELHHVMKHVY